MRGAVAAAALTRKGAAMGLGTAERAALVERYAAGPGRLRAALATVPEAARTWRPAAGEWSAHEVVCHCADSETNAAARIRHLGPHPLIEDNSKRGESTTLVNLRAAWTPKNFYGFEVYGELLNAFDSEAHDIDYYYPSRLAGEPSGGIADIHSHPAIPRTVRLDLQLTF